MPYCMSWALENLQREDRGCEVVGIVHVDEAHVGVVFQTAGILHGDGTPAGSKLVLKPGELHLAYGSEDIAHMVAVALCHHIECPTPLPGISFL